MAAHAGSGTSVGRGPDHGETSRDLHLSARYEARAGRPGCVRAEEGKDDGARVPDPNDVCGAEIIVAEQVLGFGEGVGEYDIAHR